MDQPLERRVQLPGDPGAPAGARRFVRTALQETGLDALADDVLLLASELCENAVLHAGTDFELAVTIAGGAVTVAVTDHGSTAMELRRAQPGERQATHNRGLLLVDALSSAWGSHHDKHGHQVWFTIRADDRPEPPRKPAARLGSAPSWPDVPVARWLLYLPVRSIEALELPDLVTELLRRLCDVLVADGGSVWVDDGAGKVRIAGYGSPDAAGALTVPLPLSGQRKGTLRVHTRVRNRTTTEVAELAALRIALAIESDRAREAAQERWAWLTYLAEASELLNLSLDLEHTAAIVPQIVVPRLSRWCAVHLLDERDQLRLHALTHADETELPTLRAGLEADQQAQTLRRMLNTGAEATSLGPPVEGVAVPLRAGRAPLGTLSVGRPAGRPSTPEEILMISDLARRAAQVIDNARRHAAHVAMSEALQRALLPARLPVARGIRFAAAYHPATAGTEVGGDFYDVLALGEDRWLVTIGDVCGTGPRAAARTGLVRDTLRVLVHNGQPLARAVTLLNELMLEANDPSQYATVAVAMITRRRDGPALDVELILAGHESPVLARPGGAVNLIGTHGLAVGLVNQFAVRPTHHILEPGATLVFYTDGVTERRNGINQFGTESLTETIARLTSAGPDVMISALQRAVDQFSPEPHRDDIAILAVHVPPS